MASEPNSAGHSFRVDAQHVAKALDPDVVTEVVRIFKLLSDETRLRILHTLLENKELNVRSLCDLLRQSQPAVSHHLALLRRAGLIDLRRDGKHNFYFVLPNRLPQLSALIGNLLPMSRPAPTPTNEAPNASPLSPL